MISTKTIERLKADGLAWITALKSAQIRELVDGGHLQLGLFDERNLFEIAHPDFPGERLVACRNPELAKLRAGKRQSLLVATAKELEKVKGMVERGKLRAQGEIGVRVGKVVNKYKVAKHFALDIGEGHFTYSVLDDQVAAEAQLDGIYVIRTSIAEKRMTADDAVRNYKLLSNVERAFRSMKTIDLKVRPIHHRLEDRVRSHIFLCMLAYYVEWHMREAWRPLLFADEDQAAKKLQMAKPLTVGPGDPEQFTAPQAAIRTEADTIDRQSEQPARRGHVRRRSRQYGHGDAPPPQAGMPDSAARRCARRVEWKSGCRSCAIRSGCHIENGQQVSDGFFEKTDGRGVVEAADVLRQEGLPAFQDANAVLQVGPERQHGRPVAGQGIGTGV